MEQQWQKSENYIKKKKISFALKCQWIHGDLPVRNAEVPLGKRYTKDVKYKVFESKNSFSLYCTCTITKPLTGYIKLKTWPHAAHWLDVAEVVGLLRGVRTSAGNLRLSIRHEVATWVYPTFRAEQFCDGFYEQILLISEYIGMPMHRLSSIGSE